jgi:hypothetical protein
MDLTEIADFIVVGSGSSGAMAAQTLIEGGASVTMVDVGRRDTKYASIIPETDFSTIRRTDEDQHRYLLGDTFEGILSDAAKSGAQLTPPRKFVTELVDRFMPLESDSFHPLESLAYGGLGAAWGAGCCVYSTPELNEAGLSPERMAAAYQLVADRIGISGSADDAAPYTAAGLAGLQPAAELDETASHLYESYLRRRPKLRRRDVHQADRNAATYREMDFYSDGDRSVYRPWMTVDRLRLEPRFRYVDRSLVLRFEEQGDVVELETIDVETAERATIRARRLILAAGTLGTARIVLRSLGDSDRSLPLLCNPYSYVPCIQPGMLGKALSPRKLGLAQLSIFHDPGGTNDDVTMGSIYTYRSLMLFRILPQVPLDFRDARILMRYLLPAITIVGIHHPERPGAGRSLRLESFPGAATGDRLIAEYVLGTAEREKIAERERVITRALRSMGSWAVKTIRPAPGASIHYAGTLPFADDGRPFSLQPDGRLAGTRMVSVADGSGFRFLPAKGLTLSLMANAHLVAEAGLQRA